MFYFLIRISFEYLSYVQFGCSCFEIVFLPQENDTKQKMQTQ